MFNDKQESVQLGLKKNWKQFALLVLVNAFVGGMVGMERSIFPRFAELEFGIESKRAILSFIIAFGITKAIANYFSGKLSNRFGRKALLILGWVFALPIPWMLIYAPAWSWVIAANILLGINQGFAWTSTVLMKIDLVGDRERGLAMGINEFAGYLAVGVVAYLTAIIANEYGLRPYPFYIGVVLSALGLLISLIWIRDTRSFVQLEAKQTDTSELNQLNIFLDTSFRDKTLSSVTQAGVVNNLNDALIWGIVPMLLFSLKFEEQQIGLILGIYPAVWGTSQLFTGKLSDQVSKKAMLFWGMLLQSLAIILMAYAQQFSFWLILAILLGFGTALVYPTFLSTIASNTNPMQRAESFGTFRFWRDMGYALGAILIGSLADYLNISWAILITGLLTLSSALIIQIRMPKQ